MLSSCKAGTLIKLVGVDPVVAGLTFHPYLGFFALSGLLPGGAQGFIADRSAIIRL